VLIQFLKIDGDKNERMAQRCQANGEPINGDNSPHLPHRRRVLNARQAMRWLFYQLDRSKFSSLCRGKQIPDVAPRPNHQPWLWTTNASKVFPLSADLLSSVEIKSQAQNILYAVQILG
jgi:hypothetical protein